MGGRGLGLAELSKQRAAICRVRRQWPSGLLGLARTSHGEGEGEGEVRGPWKVSQGAGRCRGHQGRRLLWRALEVGSRAEAPALKEPP